LGTKPHDGAEVLDLIDNQAGQAGEQQGSEITNARR
jgi:hypothetical protein